MINSQQIRAARALLDWSQSDLADRAGLGVATVRRIEAQAHNIRAHSDSIRKMTEALEEAGAVFIFAGDKGGAGVRLKK